MSESAWTGEQVTAIRSEDDTLLAASAGTGKTTTIVGKVLWLLGIDQGVDPATRESLRGSDRPCDLREVAAITFTEKAAHDLKRKLREAIERTAQAEELRWRLDTASIGTIHAFCASLLREHALRFEIDPSFRVLDENEAWAGQDELIHELVLEQLAGGDERVRELLQQIPLTGSDFTDGVVDHVRRATRDVRWHRDRYREWSRDGRLDARDLERRAGVWDSADTDALAPIDAIVTLAIEAVDRWEARLRRGNERDFDSLVLDVRNLLAGDSGAAALASIRARYRILIVDEFQDTDFAQRDIVFQIGRGVGRPQLFMVGDPKQSIYRFRGADVAAWNEAVAALDDGGTVLRLSRNFRCAPPIVDMVNEAAGAALRASAEEIAEEEPASRVDYSTLVAGLPDDPSAAVEWIAADGAKVDERRAEAGRSLAGRIRELVDRPEEWIGAEGSRRRCRFGDVAVLYRARTGLVHYERALAAAGIPYWQAGAPHLGERQEVLDVVNVLRLLGNRRDDLRALGFLRSPFVCLRDEIVAAIRLDAPQRPLLDAARRALDARWFVAPEHDGLSEIEREALRRGLDAYEELRALAPRIPVDELIEELLERTGYRNHLRLRDRAEEALANLRTFIHWCADYRHLALEQLLDVWDRWSSQDRGIPQAPLYSAEDDVVTLTTIHAAKGLEWPVVFLIESENTLVRDPRAGYMTDRALGPMLAGRRAERGPRAERLARRHRLEERAELARLLYVAMTRARQRLIVIAGESRPGTHAAWLAAAADDIPGARRQEPAPSPAVVAPTPPGLDWLERIEIGRLAASARPLDPPPLRFVVSATEMMMRQDAPEEWERRFVHAVDPAGRSPGRARDGSIPARMRGTVIHGVLERVREAAEISRILEETLGSIDEPGLDRALAPGSGLREQLEDEIRGVVESAEWAWYVAGEHERELPFVHLAGAHEWRIGAFDLVRLGGHDAAAPTADQLDLFAAPERDAAAGSALIVDFKTHRIDASEAEAVADRYALQARVYREAAAIHAPARVRFHFTWPNVAVDA